MAGTSAAQGDPPALDERSEGGPVKFPLRKAIRKEGEPVKEIEFREPTGHDIELYGDPVNIDFSVDPPKVSFDERKMSRMLAGLAGIPESSIRSMDPRDWKGAAYTVAHFFMP